MDWRGRLVTDSVVVWPNSVLVLLISPFLSISLLCQHSSLSLYHSLTLSLSYSITLLLHHSFTPSLSYSITPSQYLAVTLAHVSLFLQWKVFPIWISEHSFIMMKVVSHIETECVRLTRDSEVSNNITDFNCPALQCNLLQCNVFHYDAQHCTTSHHVVVKVVVKCEQ